MIHARWISKEDFEPWKVRIADDMKMMGREPLPGDIILVTNKKGGTVLAQLKHLVMERHFPNGYREWVFSLVSKKEQASDGVTEEWEAWASNFEAAYRRSQQGRGDEGRTVRS